MIRQTSASPPHVYGRRPRCGRWLRHRPTQGQAGQAGQAAEQGGSSHAKTHKSMSGKDLVGDKIKQNGKHKIHTASASSRRPWTEERQDRRRHA